MQIIEIVMIVAAYIAGSIPFGKVVFFLLKKDDITKHGSGNIGATNVARNAGKIPGLLTLILDILKGLLPVLICTWVGIVADSWTVTYVAVAAIVGHMFPIWLGFKGGKGVATALGVFLALSWQATLMAIAIFIVFFIIFRIVSLSSLVAVGCFSLLTFLLGDYFQITFNLQIAGLITAFLIFVKHHENIGRLIAGTEKKLSTKGKESS